jgi:hypothetical protein
LITVLPDNSSLKCEDHTDGPHTFHTVFKATSVPLITVKGS